MAQPFESCLSTSDQVRRAVARQRWLSEMVEMLAEEDKKQSLLRGCPHRKKLSDLVGESMAPHGQGGPFWWRLRQWNGVANERMGGAEEVLQIGGGCGSRKWRDKTGWSRGITDQVTKPSRNLFRWLWAQQP